MKQKRNLSLKDWKLFLEGKILDEYLAKENSKKDNKKNPFYNHLRETSFQLKD